RPETIRCIHGAAAAHDAGGSATRPGPRSPREGGRLDAGADGRPCPARVRGPPRQLLQRGVHRAAAEARFRARLLRCGRGVAILGGHHDRLRVRTAARRRGDLRQRLRRRRARAMGAPHPNLVRGAGAAGRAALAARRVCILRQRQQGSRAARRDAARRDARTRLEGTTRMSERIEALRRMLEKNPDDPRARFGLAAEYEKAGRWHDVVEQLTAYLAVADDEGNAWGRLGRALREIGREEEARDAYRKGIEAAARHGHPSMAAEFQEAIDELNELA